MLIRSSVLFNFQGAGRRVKRLINYTIFGTTCQEVLEKIRKIRHPHSETGYKPFRVEAPPRFELGVRVLQTHALPLGYSAEIAPLVRWSGLRGSNSLPPPWQGGALPDELCPQMVPRAGVEPATRGFSVRCSTN